MMTLEEAIDHCEEVAKIECGKCAEEHLQLAKWLKELKERRSFDTDLISKKQSIDALDEYFGRIAKLKRRGLNKGEKAISLDVVGAIKTLPSARPKRGKWIDRGEHGDWEWHADGRGKHWHEWECNICHHYFGERTFFCPHCGADMRGEQYG